jgi:hypothetical protein
MSTPRNNPTRYGTSHFVDRQAALDYYMPYGHEDLEAAIDRKLLEGEIHLGPPRMIPGYKLGQYPDGRYFLEEL